MTLALTVATQAVCCNRVTPPQPRVAPPIAGNPSASIGNDRADPQHSPTGAREPSPSGTGPLKAGYASERFVPWFVTNTDSVSSPRVMPVNGGRDVLMDTVVLRIEEQGLVPTSGLTSGLSFDLVEGPDPTSRGQGLTREGVGSITAMEGDLDHVAVAMVQSTYAIIIRDVYLRKNRRWKLWRHFWNGLEQRLIGVHVGPPGRVLMLVSDPTVEGYRFDVAGDKPLLVPTPAPGGTETGCRSAVVPTAFVTLPNGAVVVAGQQCLHFEAAIVEMWDAGAQVSRLVPAPRTPSIKVLDVSAVQANEAYVGGCTNDEKTPYLARVSATHWETIELPTANGCVEKVAVSDSALWVLVREPTPLNPLMWIAIHDPGRTQLWKKSGPKPWERAHLTTPWEVDCVASDMHLFPGSEGRPDDIWVTVWPVYDAAWPSNGRALLRATHP